MKKDRLIQVWEAFTKKNDFSLNPDSEHVSFIAEGVLSIEKDQGLKLCPCRLTDGSRDRNLELLCPCNFKTHETWEKEGRCWCGLFIKRGKKNE